MTDLPAEAITATKLARQCLAAECTICRYCGGCECRSDPCQCDGPADAGGRR